MIYKYLKNNMLNYPRLNFNAAGYPSVTISVHCDSK